jgi:hypothetical protein
MTTEVINVDLKLYETNLAKLLTTYEIAHKNYLDSVTQKQTDASKKYLIQLNDLNIEILSLMTEISQNITKLNNDEKYAKHKTDIMQKINNLNTLNDKMRVDETKIKGLMHELIDLDGKNQFFQLQIKSNRYYIILYFITIIFLIFFFMRLSNLTETGIFETLVMLLTTHFFVVFYWTNISKWATSVFTKISNTTTSILF